MDAELLPDVRPVFRATPRSLPTPTIQASQDTLQLASYNRYRYVRAMHYPPSSQFTPRSKRKKDLQTVDDGEPGFSQNTGATAEQTTFTSAAPQATPPSASPQTSTTSMEIQADMATMTTTNGNVLSENVSGNGNTWSGNVVTGEALHKHIERWSIADGMPGANMDH
ncbi:hypothetical protein BDV98DRAFT_604887 [Pterulicium gracile]|uniref:Uncharacterized protein n=1 Tax=Pterulicium gracile TaxID=1884261 RepID=A0A5C3QG93_9AGAR|nr:hypothetical protein BDV98DRAFT_604887 [Pterula gracilis]